MAAARAAPTTSGAPRRRAKAQALVELAIVMPLLVGLITVLMQLGILFIAYLSIVEETRDVGRYVAVHPDTIDGSCSLASSLWNQVCVDAPSVVDPHRITVAFTPACAALSAGHCAGRTAGTQIEIALSYDASTILFLPSTFRLGPWFAVAIPTGLPAYDYFIMVEQH